MTDLASRTHLRDPLAARLTIGAVIATTVAAVVVSHVSIALFVLALGVLAVIVAYAATSWPRPVLIIVALSPIIDRYLAPGVLDIRADEIAHFLSEGLLLVVSLVLVVQATRRGTLGAALRHPTTAFLGLFCLIAAVSMVMNAVPPAQALAGLVFTLDAAALFVLARLVGFDERQATRAILAFVGLMLAAAVVAAGQALLSPNLFGLFALQGRFGEIYRLASFFGDPNVFAALLSAAIPFTLFAVPGQPDARRRALMVAAACLLVLGLLHSFSRGGWLGAGVGFGVVSAVVDRRALVMGGLVAAAMFVVVSFMPRDLLIEGEHTARPSLIDSTAGRVGTIGEGRDLRTLFLLNAIPIIRDHPMVGVGPGLYGGAVADLYGTDVYEQYGTDKLFSNPTQRTVDNFWLHLLVETGVLGFLAFAAAAGAALIQVTRASLRAGWPRGVLLSGVAAAGLALIVNSATTMLLESNSVAFLFWLLLGIGTLLAARPANSADGAKR